MTYTFMNILTAFSHKNYIFVFLLDIHHLHTRCQLSRQSSKDLKNLHPPTTKSKVKNQSCQSDGCLDDSVWMVYGWCIDSVWIVYDNSIIDNIKY